MTELTCSWCRTRVEQDDGFRLADREHGRAAAFCRLEHVVPWAIRGPRWESGELAEAPEPEGGRCAHCGESLAETSVLLVRHRGPHRIPDAFCSVEHAVEWAKAGGRWR